MENLSKMVFSISGKKIGWLLDFQIDFENMKMLGYVVVDEHTEEEFFLPNENILSFSENFVVISDERALIFAGERRQIFGKQVLTENGQDLGFVRQIVFKRKLVEKLVTDKCEILAKFVKVIGEDAILVSFGRSKRGNLKKTFPRGESDQLVKIQSSQQISSGILPEKVMLSTKFYVGKICMQDIVGYNNEKIVQKNQVITKSIVEKAKLHNKLNQLFFAIKRS